MVKTKDKVECNHVIPNGQMIPLYLNGIRLYENIYAYECTICHMSIIKNWSNEEGE